MIGLQELNPVRLVEKSAQVLLYLLFPLLLMKV
jgi:hypothetical protein